MWIYLLYAINNYVKEKGIKPEAGRLVIYIPKLTDYLLDEVWRRNGKTIYDDEEEIHEDLKTAEAAGFLNLPDGRHIVISENQLRKINELAEWLRNNPARKTFQIVDEFLKMTEAPIM